MLAVSALDVVEEVEEHLGQLVAEAAPGVRDKAKVDLTDSVAVCCC